MKEYRLRVKEKIMKADLATIRREYTKGGLKRSDLPDNPLVLFTKWLQEAIDAEVNEPTAMLVGTVSPEGKPAIRTVLLKDLHDGKFIFYTNYGSRKGKHLAHNSSISISFVWHELERQIHMKVLRLKYLHRNQINILEKALQESYWRPYFSSKRTDRKQDTTYS